MASVNQRNAVATAYGNRATHGALYSTAGSGTAAGTEISGGSPAYARKALTWSAPSSGVITAQGVFDVPSGVTVRGAGVHTAITAGEFADGAAVTDQAFSSQGQFTVTYTYTQS